MKTLGEAMEHLQVLFSTIINNPREEGALIQLSPGNLTEIQECLNTIFPEATCGEVLYTRNTDCMFFGIYVNPTILPDDVMKILYGDMPMKISRYIVEIDSKLFDQGLDPMEITAILLHDVSGMVYDETPIWNLRGFCDTYQAKTNGNISITASVNAIHLMLFGIKDTLHKITSCFYPDSDFTNKFMEENDLSVSLGNGLTKILSSVFGMNDTVRNPKLIVLQWVFSIYQDLEHNYPNAVMVLKDAKEVSGSALQNMEIEKTIRSLNRLSADIQLEATRVLTEAKRGGLFDGLKQNGLRAIEDDLYEFRVRAKNAETEDDAMYTLRQINTRINIIEEYLYNNEGQLRPDEIERWRALSARYRELREEISRKTISHKKQYGLWFDYDKI